MRFFNFNWLAIAHCTLGPLGRVGLVSSRGIPGQLPEIRNTMCRGPPSVMEVPSRCVARRLTACTCQKSDDLMLH